MDAGSLHLSGTAMFGSGLYQGGGANSTDLRGGTGGCGRTGSTPSVCVCRGGEGVSK